MADGNSEDPTSVGEMEASGKLADSWVNVMQGETQKDESVEESREEEVERLLAEATSGEESDVQMTPNVSSAELKAMPTSVMSLSGKQQLSLMGASHQSSRAASPPKEFELTSGRHSPQDTGLMGSLGHGPVLRSLCVLIPVIICSHLAFFALGYLIGRRTATATRL